MIDINALETRIKWLEISLTDTLAWGLRDDNTCPNLLKHCNAHVDSLTRELASTKRMLKESIELNKRVKR